MKKITKRALLKLTAFELAGIVLAQQKQLDTAESLKEIAENRTMDIRKEMILENSSFP